MTRQRAAIGCLSVAVVILLGVIAVLIGLHRMLGQELPLTTQRIPSSSGRTAVLVTHAGGGAAGWVYSDLFIEDKDGRRTLVPRDPYDDAAQIRWTSPDTLSACLRSPVLRQSIRLTDGGVISLSNSCAPAG